MAIMVFVHNGPLGGRSIHINKHSAFIGRGPGNDVRIDESSVSKRHATIFKTPDGYSIEDAGSQNGTWIDGGLIPSGRRITIQRGTPISLGNVLVSVGKALPADFVPAEACIDLAQFIGEDAKKSVLDDTLLTNRRKLQQIFEISKLLTQSLDLKDLYERILDLLFFHFRKLEAGAIWLRDEKAGALRQVASKARGGGAKMKINASLAEQAMTQSKAVMLADSKGRKPAGGGRAGPVVSAMCVPLLTKAGVRGILYVHSGDSPQGFRKEDLLFITGISAPAAVAIENALLHKKSKQSEAALKKARDELEVRVRERTCALAEANAQLRALSIKDDLTGLFNRRYLDRALEAEFIRTIRYKRSFSVLLLDIDTFKAINDNYGHGCGDAVLKKVAGLVRGCLRSSDVVARYGGDEMAILLPETDKSNATEIAEKLRRLIEGTFVEWHGKNIGITISIGIATAPDDHITDWVDMMNKADDALYEGKRKGKNVVVALNRRSKPFFVAETQPGRRSS